MSANLFALNNLIAANLVTYTRTPAPVIATVYTATPDNVLYIIDNVGIFVVDRIVSEGDYLIAYDDNDFEHVLSNNKVELGAEAAASYFNPYGMDIWHEIIPFAYNAA